MDERQSQIREGAGLEESRINQDFIDFLRKWSTPALLVIALIFGVVAYRNWSSTRERDRIDRAFEELSLVAASGDALPEQYLRVARERGNVRGVGSMARLGAADAWLRAARKGVAPGAAIGPDGELLTEEDLLDASGVDHALSQAEALYREVLETNRTRSGGTLHAASALFGLGAIAESRGSIGDAEGFYQQVIELAETRAFPQIAAIARARIAGLGELGDVPEPMRRAEVPVEPEAAGDSRDELDLEMFGPGFMEQLEGQPAPGADGAEGAPVQDGQGAGEQGIGDGERGAVDGGAG